MATLFGFDFNQTSLRDINNLAPVFMPELNDIDFTGYEWIEESGLFAVIFALDSASEQIKGISVQADSLPAYRIESAQEILVKYGTPDLVKVGSYLPAAPFVSLDLLYQRGIAVFLLIETEQSLGTPYPSERICLDTRASTAHLFLVEPIQSLDYPSLNALQQEWLNAFIGSLGSGKLTFEAAFGLTTDELMAIAISDTPCLNLQPAP